MIISSQKKFMSLIILLLLLFSITEVSGETPQPPDYTLHKIDILTDGSAGHKAVGLNYHVYEKNSNYSTYNNLKDLRIVDDKGEYVPYFLESGEGSNKLSIVKEDNSSTTYKITNTEEANPNYTPFTMTFDKSNNNEEYLVNVKVYGSNNDVDYEFITKDTLYFTDGRIKDFIELPECKNYSYFKVVYEKNGKRPNFTGAYIKYGYYKSEKLTNILNIQEGDTNIDMVYEVTQLKDTNETEISIDLIEGIYIDNIQILTNGVFIRDVMFDDNLYEIYNYTKDGVPITNTKVYADSQNPCPDYTKKIIIKNNDDKPIDITGVVLTYRYDRAIFESNGVDNYYVEFGNHNLEEPVYDIQKLSNQIIDEGYNVLELGRVETTKVYETREPYDENADKDKDENKDETEAENENLFEFLLGRDIDWLNVTVVGVSIVLIVILINNVEK